MNQMHPRTKFHYSEKQSLTAYIHLNYNNRFYEWIPQWMNETELKREFQVVAFVSTVLTIILHYNHL